MKKEKYLYSYKCKKCSLEFEEWIEEENKLDPCNRFQAKDCDVYVAPHYGVAECDIELVS